MLGDSLQVSFNLISISINIYKMNTTLPQMILFLITRPTVFLFIYNRFTVYFNQCMGCESYQKEVTKEVCSKHFLEAV